MAPRYQIIEVSIDGDGNEASRLPSWSCETMDEAIHVIENVLSRYQTSGCESDGSYWWGTAMNGARSRFLIEAV